MSTNSSLSNRFEADQLQFNQPIFDAPEFNINEFIGHDQLLEKSGLLTDPPSNWREKGVDDTVEKIGENLDIDILLGSGDELIRGSDLSDILNGNDGNDVILGLGGNDFLFGGIDNDTLNGGDGNDKLEGDIGNDVLIGQSGDDRLIGSFGNDRLVGGGGDDQMLGGSGRDRIVAGTGNDFIRGGKNTDTIIGGGGRDTFMIDEEGNGFDIIGDFRDGVDKLGITSQTNVSDLGFFRDGSNTVILRGSDALAIVVGVLPSQITAADFVTV